MFDFSRQVRINHSNHSIENLLPIRSVHICACCVGEWVGCLWASRVHEHGGHRRDHQEDDDEACQPVNAARKEVTHDERVLQLWVKC